MHSWISRFACHLGHLIPGSQIQQMSSELGFWSFIIFECSENIWLSYFKINWKKSIQTIFMSLMLLCISLYLCACTSIHLFFCVCCINVCVQILQFIRTFKAEIPVRNQGRSVSCIHRSHNQLCIIHMLLRYSCEEWKLNCRRSVGGLYYLSYLDANMLLGRAAAGGIFVFTRAQPLVWCGSSTFFFKIYEPAMCILGQSRIPAYQLHTS